MRPWAYSLDIHFRSRQFMDVSRQFLPCLTTVIWPGSANDFGRTLGVAAPLWGFGHQTWLECRSILGDPQLCRANQSMEKSGRSQEKDDWDTRKRQSCISRFPFPHLQFNSAMIACVSHHLTTRKNLNPDTWTNWPPCNCSSRFFLGIWIESTRDFIESWQNIRKFSENYHRTSEYSKNSQELFRTPILRYIKHY